MSASSRWTDGGGPNTRNSSIRGRGPGGLDSVAIIAVGSGANSPFVSALGAVRILVVFFT